MRVVLLLFSQLLQFRRTHAERPDLLILYPPLIAFGRSATPSTVSMRSPPCLCSQVRKKPTMRVLAARVVGTTKPEDAIEELLIRDVVDLTWEVFRLRRARAGVLVASMSDGVRQVLDSLGHGEGRGYTKELGKAWAAGDKKSTERSRGRSKEGR